MENTLMVALAEPKTWPNKTEKASSPRRSHPHKLKTPYPRSTYAKSGLRFYFPEISRWPSRDPIGELGGLNLYGFVGNDPVRSVDLSGNRRYVPNATSSASQKSCFHGWQFNTMN
jgi:RHS repeat-associated protein